MPHTIFFSWQIDTETHCGRNFIERALERATARIGRDTEIEKAIRDLAVDRDTKDVPGTPPIVDTIFRKIDAAAVFVPDLTFVGRRADGRPTPNPNVLVEYGWALKSLTYARIVPVMNTAYGQPGDGMPFDMRHLRNPIPYNCPGNLDDDSRREVREKLAKDLESAIRAVLDSDEFKSSLPQPPEPAKFAEKQPADGRGRFRASGEPLGLLQNFVPPPTRVGLADGPVCWFRMIPTIDPGRRWSVDDLQQRMLSSGRINPLISGATGYEVVRGHDGCGIYISPDPSSARSVVFAFSTGEIWAIDTAWLTPLNGQRIVPTLQFERELHRALTEYGGFLSRLGINAPYKWVIGMQDLEGRVLYRPPRPGMFMFRPPEGTGLVDEVMESGSYSPGDPVRAALKPFFVKLYESCGMAREDWQDE